jgi:hypothetical protein
LKKEENSMMRMRELVIPEDGIFTVARTGTEVQAFPIKNGLRMLRLKPRSTRDWRVDDEVFLDAVARELGENPTANAYVAGRDWQNRDFGLVVRPVQFYVTP